MSLATINQLVADKIRQADLGSFVQSDVVDRAITQALLRYSQDKPQQLTEDLLASGDVVPLPAGWVPQRSTLQLVEYPVGQAPISVLLASWAKPVGGDARLVLLLDTLPANTPVRVHYTAPHEVDGSTVPDEHHNAVACWAAAELCRQAATKFGHDRDASMQAAAVSMASQSGDLARRAKEWLAQYRTDLGLPDPDATPGGQAAGTVVSWGSDGHRRGRFHSQGY